MLDHSRLVPQTSEKGSPANLPPALGHRGGRKLRLQPVCHNTVSCSHGFWRTSCYACQTADCWGDEEVLCTWMVCLLLCCNAGDESSCSLCIMASIRYSGKVLQALSKSGSGQASWSSSALLSPTDLVRDLAAATTSWDPCWVNGLTVFCGRKKPKSPERLRPTSADWFAFRCSSNRPSGDCMLM